MGFDDDGLWNLWADEVTIMKPTVLDFRIQDPRFVFRTCIACWHAARWVLKLCLDFKIQELYAARATWTWLMRRILLKPCHAGIIISYGMSLWHNVISTYSLVRRSFEHKARYHTTTPLDWRKFHDESRKYYVSLFFLLASVYVYMVTAKRTHDRKVRAHPPVAVGYHGLYVFSSTLIIDGLYYNFENIK